MKQGNLAISFEEEKLAALRRYMGKKELDLEAELNDALTKLYEKHVPAPVREYIDEADAPPPAAPRSRRNPKPVAPKPTEESEVAQ